jgi:hypothetical protein
LFLNGIRNEAHGLMEKQTCVQKVGTGRKLEMDI